jgi:ketosteroid isomerase-like protein
MSVDESLERSADASEKYQIAARFFQILEVPGAPGVLDLFEPNADWWRLSRREPVAMSPWLTSFLTYFPDGLHFEIDGCTEQSNRLAVQARSQGTASNGRQYDNAYHFLFEFEGGRISRIWEYCDTMHADKVLRG